MGTFPSIREPSNETMKIFQLDPFYLVHLNTGTLTERMIDKLLSLLTLFSSLHKRTSLIASNPYVCGYRFTSLWAVKIALTRESGTNDNLKKLLSPELQANCYEIPCIQFFHGPDLNQLPIEIGKHDIIVLTSPHGVDVFLQAWEKAGRPNHLKIAAVGNIKSFSLLFFY